MPPDQTPKLPKWIFFLTDAVLLLTAWFIADNSTRPLSSDALLSILACVIVGALIATVPFIAHYERVKNEALDDRQRSLESLALTVAASAEQISIAAHGLHEIAELAQRNLKAAEQLPGKSSEKITGLKHPPDHSRDNEREELKKELARLRASEGERLQSTADKLTQAVLDLTKLQAAARPEPAERARPEPVEQVHPEPAAEIPPKVETPAKRERKPRPEPVTVVTAAAATPEPAAINPQPKITPWKSEEPPPIPAATIPEVVPVAPDSNPPIATTDADASAPVPAIAEVPPAKPERKRAPKKSKPDLPAAEISAPETTKAEVSNPISDEPKLDLGETPGSAMAEVIERAVSSDGATRLLVTAYIGIGNRLFIRGAGPGLSWDKGLPLQFVSIGKWRWETGDATGPVQFKLYKNDDIECAALGTQTLDPGQQEEVTATF